MRLHRLLLQDVRGVSRREIQFPDSGVVVIAGPNEVGKSTLVDALDLLLTERDSSTKAVVRALQPVGSDVGSVVEAELSVGLVRVRYRKQWNRGAATQLTVFGSDPEQLTGRPAHERMTALLGRHLDLELYRAQRVLQSSGGQKWSPAGTLTAALDEAAGRAVAEDAGEAVVLAIEQEYRRFHTATGRPTGDWRDLQRRHRAAENAAVAARTALAEIDLRAADHAATRQRCDLMTVELGHRSAHLAALEDRQRRTVELAAAVDAAERAAADAATRRIAADRAVRDRTVLAGRSAALTTALANGEAEIARLQAALDPATTAAVDSAAAAERAHRQSAAADAAARAARAAADRLHDEAERHEVSVALAAVDAAADAVALARTALASCRVDPAVWHRVDRADRAVALAEAAADAAATHLDVELIDPSRSLTVDGNVAPGLTGCAVTEDLVLEIVGVARLRIRPSTGAEELGAAVRTARRTLADLLTEYGLADLVQAREQAEQFRAASAAVELAESRHRDLTVGRSRAELARQLQQLEDRLEQQRAEAGSPGSAGEFVPAVVVEPEEKQADAEGRSAPATGDGAAEPARPVIGPADPGAARRSAESAEQSASLARQQWRTAMVHRDRTDTRQHDLVRDLAAAGAAGAALAEQLRLSTETLAAARADCPDDELTARLAQAQSAVDEHRAVGVLARAEYDAVAGTDLAAAVSAAERALTEQQRAVDMEARRLVTLTAELEIIGAEGRQDRADRAESELTALTKRLADLTERAGAAALLHEVVHRHRDLARARYVEPFREAVVRWGRLWLGPTFDVAVGEDLQLLTRTLHGITVPVEALSTGAAEQLAVLIRLATAAVVGGADGVPVVLDDALGFTDPERLASMGPAFSGFPGSQVLLLTADPDRYRAIDGATVLFLQPDGTVSSGTTQPPPTATPELLEGDTGAVRTGTTSGGTAGPSPQPGGPTPGSRSRRSRRPPDRAELSLFDAPDLADDPVVADLLRPVRRPGGSSSDGPTGLENGRTG